MMEVKLTGQHGRFTTTGGQSSNKAIAAASIRYVAAPSVSLPVKLPSTEDLLFTT